MGRNGNLENVAKHFVSFFLQAVPASSTMFGGGAWIEDEGCEEEDADLLGSQDLSEGGLEVEERADEAISTSPCVRGTLALGDVVKVRASIAQRRGRRCGEAIRVTRGRS